MVSCSTLSPIMCTHPHPLDDDDMPSAPRHQSRPHPHPDDNAPSPSPSPLTTTTTCSCHHPCPLPLDNNDEDNVARLRPNRVHSSTTARLPLPPDPFEPGRLPPTQPRQFECNCLCPTSTAPSRARSLFSNPTMSIRVQLLVSCIHQALSSAAACLPPNRVNPSATARSYPLPGLFRPDCPSPTQLHPFECNRSSPASTRPF